MDDTKMYPEGLEEPEDDTLVDRVAVAVGKELDDVTEDDIEAYRDDMYFNFQEAM